MVFGSFIAGATSGNLDISHSLCLFHVFVYLYFIFVSEGGASIAFPVMTLAFSIPPHVARDFSFSE